jgi:PAS domain S-box-containing protein
MQSESGTPSLGSVRVVRTLGLLLGLTIMIGLSLLLIEDRELRIDGARRQSLAMATSADRLLMYELRNLERAMAGVVADAEAFFRAAPAQAPELLVESINGVLSRQPELASMVLYDAQGRALTDGPPDPSLPKWTAAAPRGTRPLLLGPLQRGRDNGWLLPIALRTRSGEWLVVRLRTSEIQRMITGLDPGRDGSISVQDARGTVLARSGTTQAHVGRRVPLPAVRAGGTMTFEQLSELDRVTRMATFSAVSGYPVVVAAGIGLREARTQWLEHVASAAAFTVLYWLGLLFLVRRLTAAEDAREVMLDELNASSDWLHQAQDASHTGVWRLEPDQGNVRVSAQAAELFGFEPSEGPLPIEPFFARMHDEDRERVRAEFIEASEQRIPFRSEFRVVLPDGRIRWIKDRGALVADARGVERMTGTIIDITDRREDMERIERAESQFRELFERNPLPFWVFDTQTLRFLAVNETAIRNYGYSREDFLAMTILDIRPRDDADAVHTSLRDVPDLGDSERIWVHRTREGRHIEVRVHSSSITFAGRPARLVLAEDVSERVSYERELAWRATHDTTTGMLNIEALVQHIDALPDASAGYSIAYVQLRDLELVAPTLGRRTSEEILREAAERFGDVGQAYGYSAYLPAESFVIVAIDRQRRDEMVASLMRASATPVQTESGSHPLEACVGLADGPRAGESAEQVIGNAALAALQARREGVAIMQFDATMASKASERLAMAGRLRQALERREFELFFQPIHKLANGRVVSLEALLRWRQPDGTLVPPSQFIPLCEESGLIVPLGDWVLEEAASCHTRLATHGYGDVAIAVNVSAVQFLSESLPQSLRALRKAHGLPRGALQVELTESAVLRWPEAARETMQELRDEGVRISIDDFGTGFSSMAYLKELPLDFLKIDRAFVTDVHHDRRNAAICNALIALGHGLGLKVIAEGVECEAQLDWLRAHGCDQAQGYYFGQPAPLAEALASITRCAA